MIVSLPQCTDNFVDVENKEAEEQHQEETTTPATPNNPWMLIASPATPRAGAMTAVIGDWLYIYGGEDYSGVRRDFFRYNLASGASEVLTSGDYRAHGTMTAVGARLYVIGGYDETGADITQNDGQLRYYDTTDGTWTSLGTSETTGDCPTCRHGHGAVFYLDPADKHRKIYIHGGFSGSSNADSDIIELDLDNNPKPKWDAKASGPARGSSGMALVGEKIYIFGGYAKTNTGDQYYNELRAYTISTDAWSLVGTLSAANGARAAMALIAIGTNLYIYGGKTAAGQLNDLWRFNTTVPVWSSSSPWRQLTAGPSGRCSTGAIAYDGRMHVYGGEYVNASNQTIYTAELWEYDPDAE